MPKHLVPFIVFALVYLLMRFTLNALEPLVLGPAPSPDPLRAFVKVFFSGAVAALVAFGFFGVPGRRK